MKTPLSRTEETKKCQCCGNFFHRRIIEPDKRWASRKYCTVKCASVESAKHKDYSKFSKKKKANINKNSVISMQYTESTLDLSIALKYLSYRI